MLEVGDKVLVIGATKENSKDRESHGIGWSEDMRFWVGKEAEIIDVHVASRPLTYQIAVNGKSNVFNWANAWLKLIPKPLRDCALEIELYNIGHIIYGKIKYRHPKLTQEDLKNDFLIIRINKSQGLFGSELHIGGEGLDANTIISIACSDDDTARSYIAKINQAVTQINKKFKEKGGETKHAE